MFDQLFYEVLKYYFKLISLLIFESFKKMLKKIYEKEQNDLLITLTSYADIATKDKIDEF